MQNKAVKIVSVVSHSPKWSSLFAQASDKIKAALCGVCVAVHHVGSTAVPGLAAKSTIDIIAEVKDLDFNHALLSPLGYEYRGSFSLPLRKSFTLRSSTRNINLHIFEAGDPEIELNLLFRDYLRCHPKARDQYASLKYKLLEDDASHKKNGAMYRGYTLGKHAFIQGILKKAGFNRFRFVLCAHDAEWKAADAFRKVFFQGANAKDLGARALDLTNHRHFVLYKGINIVGYAHVQLLSPNKAVLHMLCTDRTQAGDAGKKAFKTFLQKWMALEGLKNVDPKSAPAEKRGLKAQP